MSFLSINKIKIHYEIYGQGEPILFIHGLGSSIQDWENQITYFSAHYQVVVLDLRGHGSSDKPTEPYSVSLFTQDVAQLIQTLKLEKVNVVGHSLGGMIAFQLALDYPKLIHTLTIVNSAPAVSFPSLKFKMGFYMRYVIVMLFGVGVLSRLLAYKVFPKEDQEELRKQFIERWSQNDPKAYMNSLGVFTQWSVIDRLSELTCPTLIIAAAQDYSTVASKKAYAQLIANSEVVVIEDSRHMSIVDKPLALNQALWNFLQRNK